VVTAGALALVAVAASALTLALAGAASAAVVASSCTTSTLVITAADGYVPFSDPLEIDGLAKVSVVADIGVDAGAEVRLAWALNGPFPVEGAFNSPTDLANHTEFFETRSPRSYREAVVVWGQQRVSLSSRTSGCA